MNNDDLPEGYLLCDGAEVLKSEYGDLYNVIGDTYGEPSDGIHFVLPDLRDKFIEGSITAGSDIEAGLPNIKGMFATRDNTIDSTHVTGSFYYSTLGSGVPYVTSTSSSYLQAMNFDASRSSSIYSDDVNTVQPPSLTVRYIIKALGSGQTLIPADNTKLSVSYRDTFTIIYPNGGSKENPAIAALSTRYVENNPFPGYYVEGIVEVYYNNQWGLCPWIDYFTSVISTRGALIGQLDDDKIIIKTGNAWILDDDSDGSIFGNANGSNSLPFRVKVWKVGKIDPEVPDIQEVVNVIEKANNKVSVSYKDTFTYIYPNGGTEDSPANITSSTRYVLSNPFPGYIVDTQVEIYQNNEWGIVHYSDYSSDSDVGIGAYCYQHNNDNIVLTAGTYVTGLTSYKYNIHPTTFESSALTTSAPCRIKVWKVGKIDADVPDLQEVTVTNVLEKPKTVTTVTYEDTFTIIYPNGGTKEQPANMVTNTRYILDNPFHGYIVECKVEIYDNGQWGDPGFGSFADSSNWNGYGANVSQLNDDTIILQTGSNYIRTYTGASANAFGNNDASAVLSSAPCRVKVWKVGKVNNSTPDLQEVSVHNTITVDEDQYMKNNFTILYPNNGTAESPANVSSNSDYIMDNPFPGYYITCQPEIYVNNEWGVSPYAELGYDSTHLFGEGLYCFQHNDGNIILSTGSLRLIGTNSYRRTVYPNTFLNNTQEFTIAPCRIKVWKVGKIPTT